MSSEIATVERSAMPVMNAAAVTATMEALKTIRQFVAAEMVEGTDYGTIPGAGDKMVMLLPGAQKVNMLYNSYPEYKIETTDLGLGHVEFRVTTNLIHRGSGSVIGAGIGSASTMESKYRWRTASRVCPNCEKDTIKRSKFPDRDRPDDPPGWYCFAKIGGCGAQFDHDEPDITGQPTGRVENPDIHDVRNTVLKIAKKRSLVDASIGLGCLTELFTQDLDDAVEHGNPAPAEQPAKKHTPKDNPKLRAEAIAAYRQCLEIHDTERARAEFRDISKAVAGDADAGLLSPVDLEAIRAVASDVNRTRFVRMENGQPAAVTEQIPVGAAAESGGDEADIPF